MEVNLKKGKYKISQKGKLVSKTTDYIKLSQFTNPNMVLTGN